MPSISTSKYSTLRTCPRLFYWEQVRFIERVRDVGARAFGTLYHHGLEAWWRNAGEGDVPWVEVDAPLVEAMKGIYENAKHADTDAYDVAKAQAMMVAYHAKWAELKFERHEGGGVEQFYRVPLRDEDGHEVKGWTQIGKKDALVKFESRSRFTPVEHKTTGSDIAPGSDYITRLDVDGQVSTYIDAANALGLDCTEALYDMSRKPDVTPERKTPDDKRKMTQGKGCKDCGGSAGGKNGIKQGTGKKEVDAGHDDEDGGALTVKADCPACEGTGWKEAPRWQAFVNLEDEKPDEYGRRVAAKIAENPDAYLRQAFIPRTQAQLSEARADLVSATVEIDAFYARARAKVSAVDHPKARFSFPRNTNTCLNIYGRRCDFLDVCSGAVPEPLESNLYQIKKKSEATGKEKVP